MGGTQNFTAFLTSQGPRALVQVADFFHYEHAEGMYTTKLARYNGIPSFGLQHGFPAGFHDADGPKGQSTSDYYCLWGEYWSDWFDVTDDTNSHSYWTWREVDRLDVNVSLGLGMTGFTVYVSQVEIKVTYT